MNATTAPDDQDVSIGVAVVATEHDSDFAYCMQRLEPQADAVVGLVLPNMSLSEARNTAANRLDTDVYAFIDADAWPHEQWINELKAGYRSGALAVGGPAKPDYRFRVRGDIIPDGWEWLIGVGPYHDSPKEIRNTYGCNFSMRADIFDELGGFDESLGKGTQIPHGEETDLAKRMYQQYGERMQYRPDAIVFHRIYPEEMEALALLKRAFNQGITKGAIGGEDEEYDFVKDVLRDRPSLTEVTLLAATALGYAKGRFMHD